MPRRGAISWRRSARAEAGGPPTGLEPGAGRAPDPDPAADRRVRDEIAVDFAHMSAIVDRMKAAFLDSDG
jgi:hypothetical protein